MTIYGRQIVVSQSRRFVEEYAPPADNATTPANQIWRRRSIFKPPLPMKICALRLVRLFVVRLLGCSMMQAQTLSGNKAV